MRGRNTNTNTTPSNNTNTSSSTGASAVATMVPSSQFHNIPVSTTSSVSSPLTTNNTNNNTNMMKSAFFNSSSQPLIRQLRTKICSGNITALFFVFILVVVIVVVLGPFIWFELHHNNKSLHGFHLSSLIFSTSSSNNNDDGDNSDSSSAIMDGHRSKLRFSEGTHHEHKKFIPGNFQKNKVSVIVAVRNILPTSDFVDALVEVVSSSSSSSEKINDNNNNVEEVIFVVTTNSKEFSLESILSQHSKTKNNNAAAEILKSKSKLLVAKQTKWMPKLVFPLGTLYSQGIDSVSEKSEFFILLSSFSVIINPTKTTKQNNFVENLLKDINTPAPCYGYENSIQEEEENKNNNKKKRKNKKSSSSENNKCTFGAVQCLLLQPSTTPDALRSSSHQIADAGWTVDVSSDSTNPLHYNDETIVLSNREAGTTETAARFSTGSLAHAADAITLPCAIVNRRIFLSEQNNLNLNNNNNADEGEGGFGFDAVVEDTPTDVDVILSPKAFPAVQNRDKALNTLFASVTACLNLVEHMSMDDVRHARPSLRKQVRTSYAAVQDAITLFDTISPQGFSAQRAKMRTPHFPGISNDPPPSNHKVQTDDRTGDDDIDTDCLQKHRDTESRLRCATEHLILSGRIAKQQSSFIVPTISERLLGWLMSLRMRSSCVAYYSVMQKKEQNQNNNKNAGGQNLLKETENELAKNCIRVGVSTTAQAVIEFSPEQEENEVGVDSVKNNNNFASNNMKKKKTSSSHHEKHQQHLLSPEVQHVLKEQMQTVSTMINGVEELKPWLSFVRSLHQGYSDVLETSSSSSQQKIALSNNKNKFIVPNYKPISSSSSSSKSFLRVVWFAICCGCCGFSAEIAHFVRPLSEKYAVSLIPGPFCFCPGLPAGFSDMIARQHLSVNAYAKEELHPGENVVWISHVDPPSFIQGGFFVRRKPNYLVGRTMYEFSRLPQEWEMHAQEADELWVPSLFARQLYLNCGKGLDPERVLIVPEGIDTKFYSPTSQQPIRLSQDSSLKDSGVEWKGVFCNRDSFWSTKKGADYFVDPRAFKRHQGREWSRGASDFSDNEFYSKKTASSSSSPPDPYVFFSNFKWEPRKGWEFLFEAYFNSFYDKQDTEDVTLLVLSYVFYIQGTPKGWTVFNETYIMEELNEAMKERFPGKKLHEMPRFCIVAESVTEFELAQLFKGADAFVLPTRGEGWGLPTMQAMSMGLPVISTNWGGSVDFTTPETTFLIELDRVEEIPKNSMYIHRDGKKWATPSVTHLGELMRYVFTEREHAAEVGERAREHIVKNYDDFEVMKVVDRRLQQIGELIK